MKCLCSSNQKITEVSQTAYVPLIMRYKVTSTWFLLCRVQIAMVHSSGKYEIVPDLTKIVSDHVNVSMHLIHTLHGAKRGLD